MMKGAVDNRLRSPLSSGPYGSNICPLVRAPWAGYRAVMTAQSTTSSAITAPPLAALGVACIAIFLLTGMDAVMKGLVLVVGVYNTMLWRSLLSATAAGAAWTMGPRTIPSAKVMRLHGLRSCVVAVTACLFFWGIARMPLAEAVALSFVAPLIALYLAAILLGERIGHTATLGSIAGMVGILIIMAGKLGQSQMSGDALLGAAAVLISAVGYAYNLILARRQALVARPVEISFFQNICLSIILGVAAPFLGALLPMELLPWLALATVLSLGGQLLLSWAFARAEAQYIAPIEYTAFVWAIILGWLFFGETVGWTTILGATLIVAGCLIVALRKPKLAQPIEAAGL